MVSGGPGIVSSLSPNVGQDSQPRQVEQASEVLTHRARQAVQQRGTISRRLQLQWQEHLQASLEGDTSIEVHPTPLRGQGV